jgi:hypothetical protein
MMTESIENPKKLIIDTLKKSMDNEIMKELNTIFAEIKKQIFKGKIIHEVSPSICKKFTIKLLIKILSDYGYIVNMYKDYDMSRGPLRDGGEHQRHYELQEAYEADDYKIVITWAN